MHASAMAVAALSLSTAPPPHWPMRPGIARNFARDAGHARLTEVPIRTLRQLCDDPLNGISCTHHAGPIMHIHWMHTTHGLRDRRAQPGTRVVSQCIAAAANRKCVPDACPCPTAPKWPSRPPSSEDGRRSLPHGRARPQSIDQRPHPATFAALRATSAELVLRVRE